METIQDIIKAAEEAAREVATKEATTTARDTAEAFLRRAQEPALPPISSDYSGGEQVNYRDPPQVEKRVTIMDFPAPPPLPRLPALMDDNDDLPLIGGGGGGGDFDHMWKVTAAGEVNIGTELEPEMVPAYKVLGGIAVVQGTRVEVAGLDSLPAGTDGYVVLRVTRDSSSRAYDSSAIEWHTDEPASSDYEEYTILAEVETEVIPPETEEGDPTQVLHIRQCRNDEICSFELMIVANGELKLLPFQANSRNSYDPPS
jgi:hypothetical protein